MDSSSSTRSGYLAETLVAVGYLLFFCIAATASLVFYYQAIPERKQIQSSLLSNLPPTTPVAHISLNPSPGSTAIFKDDFSSNKNGWADQSGFSTPVADVEVKDGSLLLDSSNTGNYAQASCGVCPYLNSPHFIQASLSTDTSTDQNYGISFKADYSFYDIYIFLINAESKTYLFWHHTVKGNWSLRSSDETQFIQSYPAANILGIYANKDSLEFYINGHIVDSYEEPGTSFQSGLFGFYVDNSGFKLIVKNLDVEGLAGQ